MGAFFFRAVFLSLRARETSVAIFLNRIRRLLRLPVVVCGSRNDGNCMTIKNFYAQKSAMQAVI